LSKKDVVKNAMADEFEMQLVDGTTMSRVEKHFYRANDFEELGQWACVLDPSLEPGSAIEI